jgi:hypothetical protein
MRARGSTGVEPRLPSAHYPVAPTMQWRSTRAHAETAGQLEPGWSSKSACFTDRTDTRSGPSAWFWCRLVQAVRHSHRSKLRVHAPTPARACVFSHRHSAVLCTVRHCVAGGRPFRRPLCAAFPLGAANTSVCPPGFSKIGTAAACASAVTARGFSEDSYRGNATYADRPSGCFCSLGFSYSFYFNDDPTGASWPVAYPQCAGAS